MRQRPLNNLFRIFLLIALGQTFGLAAAQSYPNKSIRIVVPFPAGGGTDIVARILANDISKDIGQSIMVENKGGANGILGADLVAKSAPDGYTIVMSTMGNFAVNPAIYPNSPVNIERDLVPVTEVVSVPLMLTIHPSIPAKTIQEFIAYAKAQKDPLTYSSSGTGGGPHLAGALFVMASGVNMLHIPFKGSSPAYAATIGGQVSAIFDSVVQGAPYVKNGQLRALAVTNSKRSTLLPDVPAMSEVLPSYDVNNWYAIMAPTGTPLDIRNYLYRAVKKSLDKPEIKARLIADGVEPVGSSPEEFGKYLKEQTTLWAQVVKTAGIKLE
jgi:tripartite-type tricarboxylate transporter receptor subunit TctC